MPVADGEMQAYALTLDKFLDHAAKWTPQAEVVSAQPDGTLARIGYGGLRDRARGVSQVLHDRGVRAGDRVATLAWNSQAHLEAWYGIMAMGAVCHTLNPRLTPDQLAAMITRSEARLLIVSHDLADLAGRLARAAAGNRVSAR